MVDTVTWQARLLVLLDERNISKRELSRRIGRDPTYIVKMVRDDGKPREPAWSIVNDICRALEISPQYLMEGEKPKNAA